MTKLSLFALLLAGACTRVESDNILTSGMYADLSAHAGGTGTTTVSATLFLGSPSNLDYVDLTGGDQLQVVHDGHVQVMSETIILNAVGHDTTFQADNEDDEFVVDFVRDVDQGAPNSVISMPAPFTFDPVPATVSRAQPMTFSWDNASADRISFSASGECIVAMGSALPEDTGSASIDGGTLMKPQPQQGQQIPDTCEVTVTVNRIREGQLDLHYGEGGNIQGEQSRNFTFTSTP